MHEDKFKVGWRASTKGDKRCLLYDQPMKKKCNHVSIVRYYDVADDKDYYQCGECGAKIDIEKPR